MWTSIRITSGRRRRVRATASSPSLATPTRLSSGSPSIRRERCSRVAAESSARSTRITRRSVARGSYEALDQLQQVGLVEARLDHVGVGAGLDPALPVFPGLEGGDEH